MDWVHVPPLPLAAPKFLMKFHHFSISLRDFSFFIEIFCTSISNRTLCVHRWDFYFMNI
jgi:hypothetical protein